MMAETSKQQVTPTTRAVTVEKRDDGTAILWFDVPGEPVNTLRRGFEEDFAHALQAIDEWASAQAVVLASGKEGNFVAGADVNMIQSVESAAEARTLAEMAQGVMARIADFRLPVVAAIDGACLGGGLELALACAGRVGADTHETQFGQPEVQLGLIPAAGGTQRLPRLIGIEKALDLIVTGKRIGADYAQKLGLVDEIVHPGILLDVAAQHSRQLAKDGNQQGADVTIKKLLLEDNPVGRKVLFDQARERTRSRTHGNYPAPLKAIDVVQIGITEGMEQGLAAEAEAFGTLAVSPEAQNLMRVFFMQRALKKDAGIDTGAAPRPVEKVGVVGGGLMGSGIAYVTISEAGIPVRIRDINHEAARSALHNIHNMLDKGVANHKITPRQRDNYAARASVTTDYSGFGRADVVIEAVFEDLDIKRQVIKEVEAQSSDDTIFASNTSSLPITDIAEASRHPQNVVGMHYFSPVYARPLLEVVRGEQTAPDVIATAVSLGQQQGKAVIVVNDGPGFYTTRILGPYMNEALYMLLEGHRIQAIDRALVDYGFPMGPLRLLDEVGLDVMGHVGQILHDAFGDRMAPPPGVEKLLDEGRKGEKSGAGFYQYRQQNGDMKETGPDDAIYDLLAMTPSANSAPDEIARRVTLQMVNEAAHCYGEGILRSARDGDAGAVLGLGYPPFRGGPFRTVDEQGASQIVRDLRRYADEHGERFTPAPVLVTLAELGIGFYDDDAPRPGEHG